MKYDPIDTKTYQTFGDLITGSSFEYQEILFMKINGGFMHDSSSSAWHTHNCVTLSSGQLVDDKYYAAGSTLFMSSDTKCLKLVGKFEGVYDS